MKLSDWRDEAVPILRLAGPLIVAQLLQTGMGLVDTLMAGRIGAVDLAAVGLGSALWGLILLGCVGATMAISPLIAQLAGAGDETRVAAEFQQGVWVALLVGVLAVPLTYGVAWLVPWLEVDPEIAPVVVDYLQVMAWGMPGLCLYLAPRFFNEGMSSTTVVMLLWCLLLPLNVLGNYIFMYGNFGAPAMGAVGAAVSTVLGLWLAALALFLQLRVSSRFRRFALFDQWQGPRPAEMYRILKLGLPIAVSIIMEVGMFTSIAVLMGTLGKVEMAAHQIALNYASLMFMIPLGISQAITIRVGHAAGAADLPLARRRGWVGISMAAVVMLMSASFMLAFSNWIASLYTLDPAVIEMASGLLLAAALFQLSDGLQVAASGALRGLKDTAVPMLLTLVAYWLLGFPIAWYIGIGLGWGPQGLWGGLLVGLSCAALLLNLRFFRVSRNWTAQP